MTWLKILENGSVWIGNSTFSQVYSANFKTGWEMPEAFYKFQWELGQFSDPPQSPSSSFSYSLVSEQSHLFLTPPPCPHRPSTPVYLADVGLNFCSKGKQS